MGSRELGADGAGGLGGGAAVGGRAGCIGVLPMMSVEESLTVRAQQSELWPVCGRCRQWLRSKGFQPRTLQCTGVEVRWMGCLLAMCVPYETARRLLQQLTGIERAAGTLWGWVQQVGQRVKTIFTMSISKPPACRLAVA